MSSYNSIGSSTADAPTLASAFTLASEYVNTTTGTAPGLNVPAGTTVPVAQLNTLADILSTCVNSAGGIAGDGSTCGTLFAAATPSGGTAPVNVADAARNVADNPTANVASLYSLTPAIGAPFQPTLSAVPADWTIPLAAPTGLGVSANAIAFAAVYPGFSAAQTLTVTNNGATPIPLSMSVSGAASADYLLVFTTGSCSQVSGLASGATCQQQVTFSPSTTGERNAVLWITSGAPNSPLAVPLTGSGLALSGGPVTVSPSTLTFTLAGVAQPVTVTNLGTTPVAIGNINVTGQPYPLVEQTNNCGSLLAAQSICTISVEVNSLSSFTYNATMTVVNSSTSVDQVSINLPGSVNFSASPLSFGGLALGDTSLTQSVSVNPGGSFNSPAPSLTGTITGPNASDFLFPSGSSCNGGLFQCQIFVAFVPKGVGARTATLVTNYGGIQLTGTGLPGGPSFTITPALITAERVGVSSPPSNIVVMNNGSTTILLSGITLTGADSSDFAVTPSAGCLNPISPVASCNLTVVFTPSQAGPRTATLTITDATSGLSEAATLQAIADLTVTPPSIIFGNTAVGAVSAAQTSTIAASNGDPVTFQALTGSSYNRGDFLLSTGTCATQTPCTVSASFQPTATGQRGAAYQVTDILTGESSSLTLTGTGGVATVSLSTSSLTFTARDQGTTSIPQTITLTNTGSATFTVSGTMLIGANAGDFSIQGNTCTTNVTAGGSCAISVSFGPTASGSRSAILQIVSNAASSPDLVQLSGTGN